MRDIAVPDSAVPANYWRYDAPDRIRWREPTPGYAHKIAQSGEDMGHSSNPHHNEPTSQCL